MQRPLVGRIAGEDACVGRARGGIVPRAKRRIGFRKLGRQQSRPDEQREHPGRPERPRRPAHHDPHTSRIAAYAGFKRSCHVGTSQVGQA